MKLKSLLRRVYSAVGKRFIDVVLAAILLVILAPVITVIALIVKLDSPGPVFYRGVRTGFKGRTFRIFKFRSMVQNAEIQGGGTTALNDPRITSVGAFLRKTKLDEIPQLINIIRGEMSFIGPRPELPKYTELYQGEEKAILNVRPGITDISSIFYISLDEIVGGNNADENYEKYVLSQKNQLRIQYVQKQSLIFDARLFILTVAKVINKAYGTIWKKGKLYGDNQTA